MEKLQAPISASKPATKSTFLPPLQKKIFLYLANGDPKGVHETAVAMNGGYKSYWRAFNELKKKNLINAVSLKKYQGVDYPRYWITEDGAFVALCEGANLNDVVTRTYNIYPQRRKLHYFLEAVNLFGVDAFGEAYLTFKNKGKLEQDDISRVIETNVQNRLSFEGIEKFTELLRRFPEQLQSFRSLSRK